MVAFRVSRQFFKMSVVSPMTSEERAFEELLDFPKKKGCAALERKLTLIALSIIIGYSEQINHHDTSCYNTIS
jgi:hypothetical protein